MKTDKIASFLPRVRSVCENKDGNILVGIRGGEIVEFKQGKPSVILRGHFKDELWGLAVHPKRAEFCTLGEDCMFAMWDMLNRKQKRVGFG